MAQQDKEVGFKSVQLFKDQTLGIGSYGKVFKAKCDDLLCAAKLIHETLFDPTAQHQIAPRGEHRLPIRRFEQECDFLSTIKHPNIVQYLGMYQDPDTGLPVLLMELMDDSLTHFLESSMQPISYHIQVNLCHDVALALSFLHSNNIVHRDLSSNNVLLISTVRAKVTDFGMARLGDLNPHHTFTMCPGTDVYMPPEAVNEKPVHTEKIDCFSFGVIIIQVLTRQFPTPSERQTTVSDLRYPQGSLKLCVPEVQRRQNQISNVDPNHPLLPVALDCLKDRDVERPSAKQLCERVEALKDSNKYKAAQSQTLSKQDENCKAVSAEQFQGLQQTIQSQLNHLIEKDRSIEEKDMLIATGQQQLRQCREDIQQLEREKEQAIEEREEKKRQLGRVSQQLEESEQVIAEFERRIIELEQQLLTDQPYLDTRIRAEARTSIKLRWREGERAQWKMFRVGSNATVEKNIVYFVYKLRAIYVYNATGSSWSLIPDSPISNGSAAVVINGLLTIIGGCNDNYKDSNKLFSLTGEDCDRKWTEVFPPMPTKRHSMTALCTGTALIVAGGREKKDLVLKTVEVMNTGIHQWYTASHLPELLYDLSATVCGDQVYLMGGEDKDKKPTKYVYTCSLATLLWSCGKSLGDRLASVVLRSSHSTIWNRVADLPVTYSTCVSLHGHLLAIGGVDSDDQPTTAIHMYNLIANSWDVISHMATPRYWCFAAVLPDNQLMVVGGLTNTDNSDSVELANLIL